MPSFSLQRMERNSIPLLNSDEGWLKVTAGVGKSCEQRLRAQLFLRALEQVVSNPCLRDDILRRISSTYCFQQ